MTIPKIIHQIYWDFYGDNKEIPGEWRKYHLTWKEKFPEPEYTHVLWDYDKSRDLIKENYNWFLETFDNYPKHIQRVDSVRYFIMYHYGGIYADLDCEVRKNFYKDLVPDKINLVGNPYSSNPRHSMNNLMGSNKGNKNWKKAFDVLNTRKNNFFTLSSTGPVVLIDAFKNKEDAHILPFEDFNPLKKREGLRYIETLFLKSYKERVKSWDTAKVVHHGSESWGKAEVKSFFKHYGIIIFLLLLLIGYILYRKFYLKEKFIFSKNYI